MKKNYKYQLQSKVLNKTINKITKKGKKMKSEKMVKDLFIKIQNEFPNEYPISIYHSAIKNISPNFKIKIRKRGKQSVEVPFMITNKKQREHVGISWFIDLGKKNKNDLFSNTLLNEIKNALNNQGTLKNNQMVIHEKALEKKRLFYSFNKYK